MPINKKIASPDIPDDGQCFRISAKEGQRYDYNGKKYRRLSQSFKQPTRGQTPGLLHSDLVFTLALIKTRGQTPGLLHSDLVLTLALITH